jgi:hypothetical protein
MKGSLVLLLRSKLYAVGSSTGESCEVCAAPGPVALRREAVNEKRGRVLTGAAL